MKLRNKKTGEIEDIEVRLLGTNPDRFVDSLAELTEEWEDYEEPNLVPSQIFMKGSRVCIDYESVEASREAVKKLEAWKRLKDKGFRFTGFSRYHWTGEEYPHLTITYPNFDDLFDDSETAADLDLLFGGEE